MEVFVQFRTLVRNLKQICPYIVERIRNIWKEDRFFTVKNTETDALRLYPDPAAKDLVHAIAAEYGILDEQVFVGVGSDDVLAMSFLTFFNSCSF